MKRIILESAYLPDGWTRNVALDIDQRGIITHISTNYTGDESVISGYGLPGMNNIHSHAFQRAMAGLAEYSTSDNDSFWTWRDIMYRFAGSISSADLETIAAQLYLEMLKAGYVSVGEFHYLHHEDGSNLTMSQSIIDAASRVGIGLCHLPVLYMSSGFGGKPLNDGQKRFGHDLSDYLELLTRLSQIFENNPNQHLGMAFHSLRAVPEEAMKECLKKLKVSGPIHIHIAEQKQEVDDCLLWSGKRPVEWLFDHAQVDERWCLVHATHLTQEEVLRIARSGAVAGICPTTEANLGDGLFPLKQYLNEGGDIAIGSDSHISVSVPEELRLLEYGQRLKYHRRNIAVSDEEIHTGSNLYKKCLSGGTKASGFNNGAIEIGKRADIIMLDKNSSLLIGTPEKNIIDRFIFSGNVNSVQHVMVGGQLVIKDYKHTSEEQITAEFAATMDRLKKVLD